jgi:hypothetical protein
MTATPFPLRVNAIFVELFALGLEKYNGVN